MSLPDCTIPQRKEGGSGALTYLEDADLDGAVDDADADSGDPGPLQSNIHPEVNGVALSAAGSGR